MKGKSKFFKNVLTFITAFMLILGLCSCDVTKLKSNSSKSVEAQNEKVDINGELKVHFIDVGQGDCILIQQGSKNMLIDGGTNEAENTIKDYLHSKDIKKLDYVIGTHAHEDHIGSLDAVISSFNIGEVYFPKQTASTRCFESFLDACRDKNLKFNVPRAGDSFKIGEADCIILSPKNENYENINDSSIVLKVVFRNTSFIFTGDAGKEAENEMLESGMDLKADLLKVGHHGSKTATTDKFLKAVNPKYAVISVGKNNDYKLPNEKTMSKFKKNNIPVYRTDENGTITAVSDGTNITFNCRPGSYEDGKGSVEVTTNYDSQSEDGEDSDGKKEDKAVYWTEGGKSYHYDRNCSGLKKSKDVKSGKLSECPKKDPCDRCVK